MEVKKIRNIGMNWIKLVKISGAINRIDCANCNGNFKTEKAYYLSLDRQLKKAREIAKKMRITLYHQSDPRGSSLYLGNNRLTEKNYDDGIPC